MSVLRERLRVPESESSSLSFTRASDFQCYRGGLKNNIDVQIYPSRTYCSVRCPQGTLGKSDILRRDTVLTGQETLTLRWKSDDGEVPGRLESGNYSSAWKIPCLPKTVHRPQVGYLSGFKLTSISVRTRGSLFNSFLAGVLPLTSKIVWR